MPKRRLFGSFETAFEDLVVAVRDLQRDIRTLEKKVDRITKKVGPGPGRPPGRKKKVGRPPKRRSPGRPRGA